MREMPQSKVRFRIKDKQIDYVKRNIHIALPYAGIKNKVPAPGKDN
jgi:hypothetical protein